MDIRKYLGNISIFALNMLKTNQREGKQLLPFLVKIGFILQITSFSSCRECEMTAIISFSDCRRFCINKYGTN